MRMMFAARAMDNMAGGVERMIVTIMTEMVRRGHQVALFSWDTADAKAFYPMAPEIEWFRLDMGEPAEKASMGARFMRAPTVRKIAKKFSPEVIVCFQGGPFRALLLYTLGLKVPLVAAERTAPTLYEHAGTERRRRLEHLSYRFAKVITVQFDRYRSYYPSNLQKRIVETPNPVSPAAGIAGPAERNAKGRYTLLSVGRLSYQKNYSVLLNAFEKLAPRFPDWDLRIVGEGEERQKLEALIAQSPLLAGRAMLPGATTGVASEYTAANLFCLPSRWEGFPNALAEALSHGLPAVGFDGCAGVPDLIEEGKTGVLAHGNGTGETLTSALRQVMADNGRRGQMSQAAVASMQRYEPKLCFDRWEEVLKKARR